MDEITEMDLSLQAKLLRVLQEREVERLGSRKTIKLDVRVLATSNRDLKEAVSDRFSRRFVLSFKCFSTAVAAIGRASR